MLLSWSLHYEFVCSISVHTFIHLVLHPLLQHYASHPSIPPFLNTPQHKPSKLKIPLTIPSVATAIPRGMIVLVILPVLHISPPMPSGRRLSLPHRRKLRPSPAALVLPLHHRRMRRPHHPGIHIHPMRGIHHGMMHPRRHRVRRRRLHIVSRIGRGMGSFRGRSLVVRGGRISHIVPLSFDPAGAGLGRRSLGRRRQLGRGSHGRRGGVGVGIGRVVLRRVVDGRISVGHEGLAGRGLRPSRHGIARRGIARSEGRGGHGGSLGPVSRRKGGIARVGRPGGRGGGAPGTGRERGVGGVGMRRGRRRRGGRSRGGAGGGGGDSGHLLLLHGHAGRGVV
mmetsp:Transcript_21144/g.43945  ORF Transcript_21144/g.43945 Transcript_21144/m.43945 type:complete len:338 (-) Transcript_21144:874-1887(-)